MPKIYFAILLFTISLTGSCQQSADEKKEKALAAFDDNNMHWAPQFHIKIGTNLSGWLSTCADNADTPEKRALFMTKADVKWIARRGFDHVRIPVDESNLYDDDGNKLEANWSILHDLLGWVREENMRAIFDLHTVRSHNFDTEAMYLFSDNAAQEDFIALWKKLQQEFKAYPTDFLAYEILNEPSADDPKDWDELFGDVYKMIRATEPERVLILGGTNYSNVSDFPKLNAPAGDRNIILTFHFYEPYIFTHYKTSWSDHYNYVGQSEYPGKAYYIDQAEKQVGKTALKSMKTHIQYADRQVLDSLISIAVKRADELQLPLYCGEFAVFKRGPSPKFRYNWYRDVTDILRTHGIPYANWDYKAQDEFGLRLEEGLPDEELIRIMMGKTE